MEINNLFQYLYNSFTVLTSSVDSHILNQEMFYFTIHSIQVIYR